MYTNTYMYMNISSTLSASSCQVDVEAFRGRKLVEGVGVMRWGWRLKGQG